MYQSDWVLGQVLEALDRAKLAENTLIMVSSDNGAAGRSYNMLPALNGTATKPIRPYLLTQAFGGQRTLSIRRGDWKYIDHRGSGGNNYDTPPLKPFALPEAEPDAPGQLYNLATDPGETTNLIRRHPDITTELIQLLDQLKSASRSRP